MYKLKKSKLSQKFEYILRNFSKNFKKISFKNIPTNLKNKTKKQKKKKESRIMLNCWKNLKKCGGLRGNFENVRVKHYKILENFEKL